MATVLSKNPSAVAFWKSLSGIVCIYKPACLGANRILAEFKNKLSEDLNLYEARPPQKIIKIERNKIEHGEVNPLENKISSGSTLRSEVVTSFQDGDHIISVTKSDSYADHPLAVGPRYQPEDLKCFPVSRLGFNSSGVLALAIRDSKTGHLIIHNRWMSKYILSGRLGMATDNFFHTGKLIDKAKYGKLQKRTLERLLANMQSSHQRLALEASGLQRNSERLYELASEGLLRPQGLTNPVIYGIRCTAFDPPNFDIEVSVINEEEPYLLQLIYTIGLKLKTLAVCTKIRCVNFGPLSLDGALLQKHWNVPYVLENIAANKKLLHKFNVRSRAQTLYRQNMPSASDNKTELI